MTLADYIQQLRGDESYEKLGEAMGISSATVFRIATGKTVQPTPDMLEKFALFFGATEEEKRRIYADLMRLAGYLDLMPQEQQAASADEVLSENLRRMQERGRRPPTGLEGLDTASDTEGEGQEA